MYTFCNLAKLFSMKSLPSRALFICYSLTLSLLILNASVLGDDVRGWCDRTPSDTRASKTPGDNGFRIKLAGRPPPERYVPDQVYTISLNGTYTNQKLLGFYLVSVPLNARDETTTMGTFQHLNYGVTRFDPQCPHLVTHTSQHARAGIEILWTAPPAGAGCVEFRATVLEYPDIWYKDDGALTRVFCEDTGKVENDKSPEMLSDCCACGSAKYLMTFHGLWSRQTHPKDFPAQKRLLHWSNIVGASHSKDYLIWQYGDLASKGVKEVCEFGYSRTLENEMKQNSDSIRTVVKTTGIWWKDPEGLRQTRWARFSVDKTNHLLSMISMLGPSPDWCSGVSALELCQSNCTWAGDFSIDLYPWDAGTDDGVSYMSPNSVSQPQQKIQRITSTFPDNPTSPFYGTPLSPLARLEIKRVSPKPGSPEQCVEVEEDSNADFDDDGDLTDMEMKKKLMMMQGKCVTSDWLDWSECSVTCGVGMRIRKRMFLLDGVDESMCPDTELMQKDNCIGIENTCEDPNAPCAATEWSNWSPCSATCGEGVRERRRYYMKSESANTCNRDMAETDSCEAKIGDCSKAFMFMNMTAICSLDKSVGPCRGYFTRWYFDSQMKKCLPFTYGGCRGNNNRFNTMDECQLMCGQFGQDQESEEPEVPADVVDCMVTPWSEWTSCTKTCGKSYQFKTRMVKREPENGGKACPPRLKKRNKCDVPKCEANGPAVDCMVTEWTDWSDCSATCGKAAKTKRRMIKRPPENGGKKCPKKLEKRKICKLKKCGATYNQWSQPSRHVTLVDGDVPRFPPSSGPIIVKAEPVGPNSISLKWQYNEEDSEGIEGYNIYYKPFGSHGPYSHQEILGGNTVRYVLTGLHPDTYYTIRMRSYNKQGEGPYSNDVVKATNAAVRSQRTTPYDPLTTTPTAQHEDIPGVRVDLPRVPNPRPVHSPRPCEMGPWTEWSACPPLTCVQERTRPVIQREDPGGQMCGPRLSRRHCSEKDCYRNLRARIPNYGIRTR